MPFLVERWNFDDKEAYAIVVSPDSVHVGVSRRETIEIWDIHANERVRALTGHKYFICCLCFSPDGSTIASGSRDDTIRIWDTQTGMLSVKPIVGHTDFVESVAYSPDGCLVISGSWDKTIRLWDAQTGRPAASPIQTSSKIDCIAVSSDSRTIIGGSDDSTIKAYELATGTMLFECSASKSVISVAFSPDNLRIVSASFRSAVCTIWDATNGHAIGEPLKGADPWTYLESASFSPDGRYIAAGSSAGNILIWDAETGAMYGDPLEDQDWRVTKVAFTPDGSYIVCITNDFQGRAVKIWDVRDLGIQTKLTDADVVTHTQARTVLAEDDISGTTTPEEAVIRLGARGCSNLSDQLDMASCSEHPVSSGGFGDVYRCKLTNGTEIAIKTFRLRTGSNEQSQKHVKHITHELYTWSKCHHTNVHRLLGLVMFRGQIGMVSAWETNGNMPEYLERHRDVDRCIMSAQIAEGLSYLHESGVVHGDLKGVRVHEWPGSYDDWIYSNMQANILISKHGVSQLTDFGNATIQEHTLKFTGTSTKAALSSRWAAPELFEGGPISFAADVYALGMTVLEAITGSVPWGEQSERSIMFLVTVKKACPERPEEHMPTYSEHGDALWVALKSCWEAEPEKRPAVDQVKAVLKRITHDGLQNKEVEMADA